MDLTIRSAVPEDAAALLAFLNRVGGESDNLTFGADAFAKFPVEQEAEIIRQFQSNPRSLMLMALSEGEIVSVASLQSSGRTRLAHRGTVAVSVRRDHWRRGIGRRMLEELLGFGRSVGLAVIELQVRADNAGAIALYEGLGFEKIGLYEKFFQVDGGYFDAWLMNLYL